MGVAVEADRKAEREEEEGEGKLPRRGSDI